MDRNKVSMQGKFKASTLAEVIVAMVIMVSVFGIGMMIFTNVMRLSLSAKKIKAAAIVQGQLENAAATGQLPDEAIQIEEFKIVSRQVQVDNEPGLVVLQLIAYDAGQEKVIEAEEIISKPDGKP